MKAFYCSMAIAAMAVRVAVAQDIDPHLQRTASERTAGGVPGIVIATTAGGRRQVFGVGVVSAASRQQPDADTVYEIGSITKTFTALLLADAAARGAVTLGQPVASLLPGYVIPEYEGQPITLLDLATQSSGLPRLPDNLLPRQADNPYADYTPADLNSFLKRHALARAPGAAYAYSNLGFGLLGLALATGAHRSYADLVHERITGPLGMRDTAIALTARMQARLAPGHDAQGHPVPNWDLPTLAGAGALRSSARDLLTYLEAHLRPQAVAAPLGLRDVWQPRRPGPTPTTRIGLAWHTQTVRGRDLVWHSGMTGGYASFIGFTADGERGVVVLANAAVGMDDIGIDALAPPEPTAPAAERRLPVEALQQYVGRYQLAPGMVLTISATADGLQAQASGQPAAKVFARDTDEFFYKVVDARLQFERGADGNVTAVTLHQGGRAVPAPRIKAGALAPERSEIAVAPELLRQYAGSYALAPGFRLVVTVDAGRLQAQATGQGRNPLFAFAPDAFFFKAVDAQLTFRRDAGGAVTGLVLHQNGRDVPAMREPDRAD